MMAKCALSSQFVTVCVSTMISFPAKAQQTTALLDGGTAKAIGETATFLKEQGKVETVLPDYSPRNPM